MIRQLHDYGVEVSLLATNDTVRGLWMSIPNFRVFDYALFLELVLFLTQVPTGRAIIQVDPRGENSIGLVFLDSLLFRN